MRNNFQIWVDAVCEQVRFWPDRKAIAKELAIHYEDHVQDLVRLGQDPELAEARALEAMGNAQEVGRSLDQVHKPLLGWLWEVSRGFLLALTAMALVTLFWTIGWDALVERPGTNWLGRNRPPPRPGWSWCWMSRPSGRKSPILSPVRTGFCGWNGRRSHEIKPGT